MKKFNVEIEMGNDAMLTREDVASALGRVAEALRAGRGLGPILDENGNKVGTYGFYKARKKNDGG